MTRPLDDKSVDEFGEALHDFLMSLPENKEFQKAKENLLDHLWSEMEFGVIDRMSETITGFVCRMAGNAVEEILQGRDDQMRRYLGLDGYTGRSGQGVVERTPAQTHKVIHGKLFETGAIEIRKKMAQAHADLIRNERIKDLEDQVAGLVEHISEKDDLIEKLRDRVNY